MKRYLVVQLNWLQGQGTSVYLDVASLTDTREAAEEFAEREGGFLIEADWWPAPDDPRRQSSHAAARSIA